MSSKHIGTHHRHMVSYPRSVVQSIYTLLLVPLVAVGLAALFLQGFASAIPHEQISLNLLVGALGITFLRLLVAYLLAITFAIPMSLLVTESKWAERIFLPFFDVIQSVPVLAFFPVIIIFFVHFGLYSGAAIFILFISMLWSIVFSLVGGLHAIPPEVKAVGTVFGLKRRQYLEKIILPAVVPYFVTGSLLAFASGWNIVTVAEVLHTYIPGATASSDIFGIGSILVHAAASGEEQTFMLAIAVLVTAIALINFFVWQKLLKFAERFRFE